MDNFFNDFFGNALNSKTSDLFGAIETELDKAYKEAKRKSNLKLCKMKSGRYKIFDYYENVVYECDDVFEAKKYFIKITG